MVQRRRTFGRWLSVLVVVAGLWVLRLGEERSALAGGDPVFVDIDAAEDYIPGVYRGSAAWGDYDSDGDLDILLTGRGEASEDDYLARVYRNDGGTFVDSGAADDALPGVQYSSADWGDYDNDGDLDILLTGHTGAAYAYIANIYRNDDGTFVDSGAADDALLGVSRGAGVWGDYDNDGDLDILLTGHSGSTAPRDLITRVYRNDEGTFVDSGTTDDALQPLYFSSTEWGDYDNDDDLDILLTGNTANGPFSRIYRNDAGTFVESGAADDALVNVNSGSVDWGDYDNDGDLDILLIGYTHTSPSVVTIVYRNDAGIFVESGAADDALVGADIGSAKWGDYDNDGDLDILLTGRAGGSSRLATVYRNDAGTFVDSGTADDSLLAVLDSSVGWGDYDNDGDLDILLTGSNNIEGLIAKVYRNEGAVPNAAPNAPTNLNVETNDTTATLTWDAATDDHTPAAGLTYNVRVGTTPGGSEIVSSMTLSSVEAASPAGTVEGYRLLPAIGNAQHGLSFTVTNLDPATTYYWSVQAVDTAFLGGLFADADTPTSITLGTLGAASEGGGLLWVLVPLGLTLLGAAAVRRRKA